MLPEKAGWNKKGKHEMEMQRQKIQHIFYSVHKTADWSIILWRSQWLLDLNWLLYSTYR